MTDLDLQPKTSRGKETKRKLLEAAEVTFGEKGFFQTGITDLTRQAEVSLGTFYTYFKSKEDIYRELVLNMQRMLRKKIKEETADITDRLQMERKGFSVFFTFLKEHKYLLKLFRQAEFVDPELHKSYFQTFSKGYIEGLKQSMKKEEIKSFDPEVLVYSLMGIVDYIGMKWIIWEEGDVDQETIDELMRFVFHGLAKD